MSLNRRSFCLGMGSFASAALASTPSSLRASTSPRAEHSWTAFGTSVRLTLRCRSQTAADEACAAAERETELIERLFSVYQPGSQLSELNRQGQLRRPHPYLKYLLGVSRRYHIESQRAFDVTVQPLWRAHQLAANRQCSPDATEIREARQRVGQHRVVISNENVELRPGTQLTLNGIAQGFATDRIKGILLGFGIQDALIDMGELAAMGWNDQGKRWLVGIQHARQQDAFMSLTRLESRCLATSGDYATTFTSDFQSHHIFDPQTGVSPTELASVSVLAPSATAADAISTALVVMGVERGAAYLRNKPRVDALFVRKDGGILRTAGFPRGDAIHG